jgi:ribose 5-phosphate isomerase B
MNIICMGGRTVGPAVAWDLVETFLAAEFSGAERHLRRLGKVAFLEVLPVCDRQGVGTTFHEP